ncbi:serine/threonine protein kinase [Verrucomicrobiota bacterium]|nr:serine/threonine protein kinase [Verrucomicrobiota bacterium]
MVSHSSSVCGYPARAASGLRVATVLPLITLLCGMLLGLPVQAAAADKPPLPPLASTDEMRSQWPRFRGPGGLGVSSHKDVPVEWDGASGKGILWKTALPLPGYSSPIVWRDRIFLSGADKDRCEVYCLDVLAGTILWQKPISKVGDSPAAGPTVFSDDNSRGGYAASTMATDGRLVYAMFATGAVAAFSFEGNLAWARNLGAPANAYGHAASLLTHGPLLIVQLDQGGMADEKLSALIALDGATGKEIWRTTPRPVPNSWSTPIVIKAGKREELITTGNPWVIAYDPEKGKEFWRVKCLGGEVTPSPAFGDGMVVAAMENAKGAAILPGGEGDVTATSVLWTASEALPAMASPLVAASRVFFATGDGLIACLDVQDGTRSWAHDFKTGFHASPAFADGRVYALDKKGIMHVLAAGKEFKEIAASPLGEPADASPAFADGRLYVRGVKHLFAIGKRP